MNFESNHLYHIYNQGNNKQKVFFCDKNYLFFIEKIKTHILPFADVLAWCLMPNHFHLMVYVHTLQHTHLMTQSHQMSLLTPKTETLIQSIAIMLRSYTRAINLQENRSGSLFRPHTKAICLTQHQGLTPAFYDTRSGTALYHSIPEKDYPQVCFNYIHKNPFDAGLVKHPADWPYSSYMEFLGSSQFKLTHIQKAKEMGLSHSSDDSKSSDE